VKQDNSAAGSLLEAVCGPVEWCGLPIAHHKARCEAHGGLHPTRGFAMDGAPGLLGCVEFRSYISGARREAPDVGDSGATLQNNGLRSPMGTRRGVSPSWAGWVIVGVRGLPPTVPNVNQFSGPQSLVAVGRLSYESLANLYARSGRIESTRFPAIRTSVSQERARR